MTKTINLSSQDGERRQTPNSGVSLSILTQPTSLRIQQVPPTRRPRRPWRPSAPMTCLQFRPLSSTSMLPLDTPFVRRGSQRSKLEITRLGRASRMLMRAGTALRQMKPSKATKSKPAKTFAQQSQKKAILTSSVKHSEAQVMARRQLSTTHPRERNHHLGMTP